MSATRATEKACKTIKPAWLVKTLRVFCLLFLALPAAVHAAEYAYVLSNGTITISKYIGASTTNEIIIPSTITNLPVTSLGRNCFVSNRMIRVTVPNSITNIGYGVFSYCYNLTNATIGTNVNIIGDCAFYNCTNLIGVMMIPDSVVSIGSNAFSNCRRLDGASLGRSVSTIGDNAFYGCSNLAAITISDGATNLGSATFNGCSRLGSVTIGASVTGIGADTFRSCVGLTNITISASVTNIGDGAFYGCTNLPVINIPSNLVSIGVSAFNNCSRLGSIALGSNVTTIGKYAFQGCLNLSSIVADALNPSYSSFDGVLFDRNQAILIQCPEGKAGSLAIPEGVTGILDSAFYNCSNLVDVTIPSSVAGIGDSAFYNCSSLTNLSLPAGVVSIGDFAFNGCRNMTTFNVDTGNWVYCSVNGVLFNKAQNALIRYPVGRIGDYTIPDGITSIRNGAFSGCTGMTGVAIGKRVTDIDDYSFYYCTSLNNVVIPDAVTNIGAYSFYNCSSLTNVTIPGSVNVVGSNAFSFCANLTDIVIGNGVGSIGAYSFYNCNGLTNVVIAFSVTNLGDWAFYNCTNNLKVYFAGDAPVVCSTTFTGDTKAVVYYIMYGTMGWGTTFGGRPAFVWPGLSNQPPTVIQPRPQSVTVGVSVALPLRVTSGSPVISVAVLGLPAGLTYNAARKVITGVPLVAVRSKVVTVAAWNAAGKVSTPVAFSMTVDSLPDWAYGSFNGWCQVGSNDFGIASMAVTKLGRISGKLLAGGTNYVYSASSYTSGNYANGFRVTTNIVSGQQTNSLTTNSLTLAVNHLEGPNAPASLGVADGWFGRAVTGAPSIVIYRNVWGDADMKTRAVATDFNGYYTATLPQATAMTNASSAFGSGYLAFTVSKGVVRTAGKLADGTAISMSSPLLVDLSGLSNRYWSALYSTPAVLRGGLFFGLVEFMKKAGNSAPVIVRPLGGDPLIWDNRTPVWDNRTPLVSRSGPGFKRDLGLVGGWYRNTAELARYYTNMTLTVGTGVAPAPVITVGMEDYQSVCWKPDDQPLSVATSRCVVRGITALKAGAPVKEAGGAWNYAATNAVGLTFALTPATGVFRGSFKAWFDYRAVHTSRRIAFEGIMTPERADKAQGFEGRGFYLQSANGIYIGSTGTLVSCTYKASYDFVIQQ